MFITSDAKQGQSCNADSILGTPKCSLPSKTKADIGDAYVLLALGIWPLSFSPVIRYWRIRQLQRDCPIMMQLRHFRIFELITLRGQGLGQLYLTHSSPSLRRRQCSSLKDIMMLHQKTFCKYFNKLNIQENGTIFPENYFGDKNIYISISKTDWTPQSTTGEVLFCLLRFLFA